MHRFIPHYWKKKNSNQHINNNFKQLHAWYVLTQLNINVFQVNQSQQSAVSHQAHVEDSKEKLKSHPSQFPQQLCIQQPKGREYKWNHQLGLQSKENKPDPKGPQIDAKVEEIQNKDARNTGVLNMQKRPLHSESSGQSSCTSALNLQKQNPVQLHTAIDNDVTASAVRENTPKSLPTSAERNHSQTVVHDISKGK